MNANRMKYASTPTYGMQKRGFLKKAAPARPVPEAPDFSQVPQPASTAVPMQSIPSQPGAQAFAQPPAMPGAFMQSSAYFSQPTAMPGMQPTAQLPFASPNFVQSVASPLPPLMTPRQSAPAAPPLPLGNSAPAINTPGGGFSTRTQGYVPPASQPQTFNQQPMAARPSVQPAMMGGMPLIPSGVQLPQQPYQQPMTGFMPHSAIPQNTMPQTPMGYGMPQQQNFAPVQQPAPIQPPSGDGQPPLYAMGAAPKPQRERNPMDADRLWTIFLFGLLPLLFIPCLFVPASWNVLRYAFLGLCVLGLGGMWYRQMYASATRLIVSIVYMALCIVTIAMMMQGGRDVRQTAGGLSQPSVQATMAPDGSDDLMAAGVMTAAPESEPTPAPTVSGPSEAERRLELFMSLWQLNNTAEMVSLVQPSWASVQDGAQQALFNVLKNRTPLEYTIEEVSGNDQDNSRTVTMTATIDKNNGKDPSIFRFMVIMVKEGGEWYVDPNSLASNDEVKTNDDGNVVNDLTVAAATATPRTTVTPAPPASTLLYYNENGGSFYHLDPNCPSVKDEYLPLTGSFPYSELKAHLKDLKPCLKCGAPTSALPDSE